MNGKYTLFVDQYGNRFTSTTVKELAHNTEKREPHMPYKPFKPSFKLKIKRAYWKLRDNYSPKALTAKLVNKFLPPNVIVWPSLRGVTIKAKAHPSYAPEDNMSIDIGFQEAPNPNGDGEPFSEHNCIVASDGEQLERHDISINGLLKACRLLRRAQIVGMEVDFGEHR